MYETKKILDLPKKKVMIGIITSSLKMYNGEEQQVSGLITHIKTRVKKHFDSVDYKSLPMVM